MDVKFSFIIFFIMIKTKMLKGKLLMKKAGKVLVALVILAVVYVVVGLLLKKFSKVRLPGIAMLGVSAKKL